MMDSESVITHATHGIVKEIAADYEVSLTRAYEMLGGQCAYAKAKRLIRAIARHNQSGARLIKADLDAMFADILTKEDKEYTASDLHKEAFEAVHCLLENKAPSDQKQELRELITVAELMLEGLDKKLKVVNG